jgi:hypothetical protein
VDPAVILRELKTPTDRPFLQAWKNGHIIPVTSKDILHHTIGLLIKAGISADIANNWALWLSHPNTSRSAAISAQATNPAEFYVHPCAQGLAEGIITDAPERFKSHGKVITTLSPVEINSLIG